MNPLQNCHPGGYPHYNPNPNQFSVIRNGGHGGLLTAASFRQQQLSLTQLQQQLFPATEWQNIPCMTNSYDAGPLQYVKQEEQYVKQEGQLMDPTYYVNGGGVEVAQEVGPLVQMPVEAAPLAAVLPVEAAPLAAVMPAAGGGAKKKSKTDRWTPDEHKLFLIGLKMHDKHNWKSIAENFVPKKSSSQVASHAQKYLIYKANEDREGSSSQPSNTANKKRKSIHAYVLTAEDLLPEKVKELRKKYGLRDLPPHFDKYNV